MPAAGQAAVATVETQAFANFVEQTYPNSTAAKLFSQFQPISYPTYNFKNLGTPVPGSPTAVGPSNGIFTVGSVNYVPDVIYTGNQYSGRIDYDLRPDKDRVFVNYYNMHSVELTGGARPAFNRPEDDFDELLSLNETHIFSPTQINEFKFGLNRTAAGSVYPPNLEVPTISISGGVTGFGLSGQFPAGWYQTEFTYKDTFSWIRGGHSFKFGAEVRREWSNSHQTTDYVPVYAFNSILNFAVDQPASETALVNPVTGQPATLVLGMRATDFAGYFNDDWKVRPNLTISYGLRYERFGTWKEINGLLRNMVLGPGSSYTQQLASASMQFVPQLYHTPNKDFMPRFGFAWNPDGKGKTSIRGGYGLYFDRIYATPIINIRSNPPYRALATSGYQYGTTVYYGLGSPDGSGFPVDPDWLLGLNSQGGIKGSRVSLLQIVDPKLPTVRGKLVLRYPTPGGLGCGGGGQLSGLGRPSPAQHSRHQSLRWRPFDQRPIPRLQPELRRHAFGRNHFEFHLQRRHHSSAPSLWPWLQPTKRLHLRQSDFRQRRFWRNHRLRRCQQPETQSRAGKL